jgi:hypothetical protein
MKRREEIFLRSHRRRFIGNEYSRAAMTAGLPKRYKMVDFFCQRTRPPQE